MPKAERSASGVKTCWVRKGNEAGAPTATRRSPDRFQGKKGWMSSGALPPAAAPLSRYPVSQQRGLSYQWARVADKENMAVPEPTGAVGVFPRQGWAAASSSRSVIVHRNTRVIHEPHQARPVLFQAFQNLAIRLAEFGIGEFFPGSGTHGMEGLRQGGVLLAKLRRIGRMAEAFSIHAIHGADAANPLHGPRPPRGPTVAPGHKVASPMRPRPTEASRFSRASWPCSANSDPPPAQSVCQLQPSGKSQKALRTSKTG